MEDIVKNINSCGIPLETSRPADLLDITNELDLISNSKRTISLRVFRRDSETIYGEKFLEKTFRIPSVSTQISDHNEILFYSELCNEFAKIQGVECANALALRWSDDSVVSLRLEFVKDTVVAESFHEKENAMVAVGRIANHFYNKTEMWPTWLRTSTGIGSEKPENSLKKTTELFSQLGLLAGAEILDTFYDNRDRIAAEYKKCPMSISHGDANHQNVRFVPKNNSTLFLDWPRVRIASVADDAARIIQPWIVFHSNALNMDSLVKLELKLYRKFLNELRVVPTKSHRFVRSAYEIRTVINAIALGSHVLSWLQSSNSKEIFGARIATATNWYSLILTRIRELNMSIEGTVEEDRICHLKNRYLGKGASEYDNQRKGNKRWQMEHEITERFLAEHSGKSVLDLPVGTGRFLGLYKKFGMSVFGVDRSSDMLLESQSAAEIYDLTDLALVLGDAVNFNPRKLESDIVVCTRFLNWLPSDLARKAFLLLSEACRDEMLITLSSIDESKFIGTDRQQVEKRLQNMHVPKAESDLPPNGAHSYLQFQEWIETGKMQLVNSELLLEGRNHLRVEIHRLKKVD